MTLPPLLTVGEVQERYRLADPKTARAVMHQAGAIRVGGRLLVSAESLSAFERQRITTNASGPTHHSPVEVRRPRRTVRKADVLGAYWWREVSEAPDSAVKVGGVE